MHDLPEIPWTAKERSINITQAANGCVVRDHQTAETLVFMDIELLLMHIVKLFTDDDPIVYIQVNEK